MNSKAEEKQAFDSFITNMPETGYLYPLLREMQPAIDQAIDQDFCVLLYPAHERLREQRSHEETIRDLMKQQDALRAQIRALSSLKARAQVELCDIANQCRSIIQDCTAASK
jgi:hypothetical protein